MDNNKKSIYFYDEGVVMKKQVYNESSVSKKLAKLRLELEKYATQYEKKLREQNIEEQKIKELSHEWIEQTLRHYEVNFGDELDSIITYLECKIEDYENQQDIKEQNIKCR